jgi:5-methyltetrahydrofolate--homocysteine methyltransferase
MDARMKILKDIALCVEKGDSAALKELIRKALAEELPAENILYSGLIAGMESVGLKFKRNDIFIPEVLIASRAMKAGMDLIRGSFIHRIQKRPATILLGTVKGDIHDLGKRIVGTFLESWGYEVRDIGVDVSKEQIVEAIRKEKPAVVGLSALLTTTMIYIGDIIEAVRKAGLKQKVKIIIGGAPVTQTFAYEVRADGYSPDAASAVELVNSLLKKGRRIKK